MKIRYWQWPNVWAIDAALIAVVWQTALAIALSERVGMVPQLVLGLSVWLTYLADRLFDVSSRAEATLLSARHRFSKRHAKSLWRIWFAVLAVNLTLATHLTPEQLTQGARLLLVCLLYTLLNQKLSRRFFPKEICVALIYAGGVVAFLPEAMPMRFFGGFACLCLLNCLVIGAREKTVDAEMQIHSVAPIVAEEWLVPAAWIAAGLALWSGAELSYGLALGFGLLGLLHRLRRRIAVETFRVLADAVMLISPLTVCALTLCRS